MKKLITMLAVLIASNVETKAQSVNFSSASAVVNYADGSWIWKRSCGGFSGQCINPSTTGYTQGLIFSKISSAPDSLAYVAYKNGVVIGSGKTKPEFMTVSSSSSWKIKLSGLAGVDEFLIYGNAPDSLYLVENCGDCYSQTYFRDLTVGIKKNSLNSDRVRIFPVPAGNSVKVDLKNNAQVKTISFFDISGKQVNVTQLSAQNFDVSSLETGIYFILITSDSGQYWSKFAKK